jgi:hypothetical protein
VKSVAYLTELGAELLETSMVIGDNAYDVIPGWMGAPIALSQEAGSGVRSAISSTDEELLAQFLMRNL